VQQADRSSYRSTSAVGPRPTSAANPRPPLLLSIDGTERRTAYTRTFYDAYRIQEGSRNSIDIDYHYANSRPSTFSILISVGPSTISSARCLSDRRTLKCDPRDASKKAAARRLHHSSQHSCHQLLSGHQSRPLHIPRQRPPLDSSA